MNFLEISQTVAEECGVGRTLTAVAGQTGRYGDVVRWVNTAWRMIQNKHANWHFMRSSFTVNLTSGDGIYLPSDCTDERAGAVIANFSSWILDSLRIYDSAVGIADQRFFPHKQYDTFRDLYLMGSVSNNRPVEFTVRPYDSALLMGPTPNASTFVVTGEFMRSASDMAADDDEPGMPAQFHDAIVWQAVMLYANNEESAPLMVTAKNNLNMYMAPLEANQLPEIQFGAPLVA